MSIRLRADKNSNDVNCLFSDAPRYVVGEIRFKDCEEQGMLNIKDQDECKAACEELGIPIGTLKNNKICFRAPNNQCRQQNSAGNKRASRICKKQGSIRVCR